MNVPYDEKDEAKELGAWWDPKRKQWCVRPNKDVTPFAHWNPKPDDGKCLGCGEFIEEHESHEGEEYKCCFCDRDICGKCLPFSEEGSWRCDGCGAYSCNALGTGSKKCPQFLDKKMGMDPICHIVATLAEDVDVALGVTNVVDFS